MKCPGCGEDNDAGMVFCIICGHSLAPPPAPAAPAAPISKPENLQAISAPRPAAAVVLFCTTCNRSDPLNGQFCVFCGGRTAPAPAGFSGNPPVIPATALTRQEKASVLAPAVPARRSILGVVLAVIAGLAVSVAAAYQLRPQLEKLALRSFWPSDGVIVFSSSPDADLFMQDARKKSLIIGKTSSNGSLYIPSLSPGSYVLNLSSSNGKSRSQEIVVKPDEAAIVGYPARLELK